MLQLWNLFEIAGTVSFAASGAIVGMVKNMDVFGITVLAVLTAVGGGMIRDVRDCQEFCVFSLAHHILL